jgi:hypothetical protein
MTRRDWTRLSKPGCKCSALWRHDPSGWLVQHCGHQTAIWPYYLVDPAFPESATMTHNGRGFTALLAAFEAVEGIVEGTCVATNENCVPGVRRVLKAAA